MPTSQRERRERKKQRQQRQEEARLSGGSAARCSRGAETAEDAGGRPLQIQVRSVNGDLHCLLSGDSNWLVGRDLKPAISDSCGIDAYKQCLTVADAVLQEEDRLSSYCGASEAQEAAVLEVTLVLRPEQKAEWLRSVCEDFEAYSAAPMEMQLDPDIFLAAIEGGAPIVLGIAPKALTMDRSLMLAAVQRNPGLLSWCRSRACAHGRRHYTPHLASYPRDREFVLHAVSRDGCQLFSAAPELKGDREVVLAAVRQNAAALHYADAWLQADREIFLSAVRGDGSVLQHADSKLRMDKEIVLAAVLQDGTALEYAPKHLRGDIEVARAAVQQNPSAVRFVANKLRWDFKGETWHMHGTPCMLRARAERASSSD
eukprot:TRINITY_DN58856_c0_g1_i1.p1 TRINITY_DN58856_c0_g1~~TRINITY_DN58856_c0_g1_i1.p1  ORF type:complete len:372 (+),score=76.64 TRINITY_DN58856_c0_g1_i1:237-1352(+)